MAYTYHGTSGLVKTGEVITVLPSGLIQKKLTFVGRKSEGREAAQIKVLSQLGNDFFAFPTLPSEVNLNNGFIQYDIIAYKKESGAINSAINYKYRKFSSFIIEDPFIPRKANISVEVGVRSTIVLSEGTRVATQDENGNTVTTPGSEKPVPYQGKLFAYNEDGSVFISLRNTEIYRYTDPVITTTINVIYEPSVVIESVSSTYYGHFTEYITTSSLIIVRTILSQSSV
jgi:hypothetical protein